MKWLKIEVATFFLKLACSLSKQSVIQELKVPGVPPLSRGNPSLFVYTPFYY
jgi:hypothetical protein